MGKRFGFWVKWCHDQFFLTMLDQPMRPFLAFFGSQVGVFETVGFACANVYLKVWSDARIRSADCREGASRTVRAVQL